MTSRLHFELFMQQLRIRAAEDAPRQLVLEGMRPEEQEDVGSVRLSRIEAAMKEARAGRAEE
ncbi:MAG TPA: hypothetical protein VHB46_04180 [Burkholderiales bacterium]|nr:hypothetical protein [Burkholderiales bacterium]